MYWDGWITPMPLGWVVLCLALIGAYVVFMGRGRWRNSALHTLNEQFARGEIGDAEYKAKREAILML